MRNSDTLIFVTRTYLHPPSLRGCAADEVFPSLDNFKHKDKWWVLDVGGNHLRVIAFIQFVQNRMYVKHIVTHAEYDGLFKRYSRGKWS